MLTKMLPRWFPKCNSAFCFPSVKLAAIPVLSSLRYIGMWHSTCGDCFQSQDGGLLPSHSGLWGETVGRSCRPYSVAPRLRCLLCPESTRVLLFFYN